MNWHLIGPNDIPSRVPTTNARGVGQIHYIYKDPHDATGNTMFACSPVGGLFRSTDDGETWLNAGTDKGLPRSGVSSVVVDSHDAATWYVSTGNGESYKGHVTWQLSIGLYKTTDAGTTWSCVGLDEKSIKSMRKVIEVKSTQNTTLIVTTTSGLYRIDDANTANPTISLLISGYGRTLGWTIRPKKTSEGKIRIYGRIVNPMYLYYDDLSNNVVGKKIKVNKDTGYDTHADYHYLMVEDNDSIIWAGTDGGVYRGVFVNDNTIQWESKCNG